MRDHDHLFAGRRRPLATLPRPVAPGRPHVRRLASRSRSRRRRGGGRGRARARSSSSNVSPSAIPKSASRQRSSMVMSSMPAASAMAVAVACARRSGLVTMRVPGASVVARSPASRSGDGLARGVERRVAAAAIAAPGPGRRRVADEDDARHVRSAVSSDPRRRRTRDRRRLERRHLVAHPDRGFDQAHRQRRTGPLPEPQVEVEQRPAPERLEDRPRDPARSSDAPRSAAAATAGWSVDGNERGGPVMKPSRTTGMRASAAADDDADEQRDLETADGREHADRVAPVGTVDLECAFDGRDLVAWWRRRCRFPGPSPRRRAAGQDRADGARGRGVADPHLADPQEIDAARRRARRRDRSRSPPPAGPRHGSSPDQGSCRRSRHGSCAGPAGRRAPGRRRGSGSARPRRHRRRRREAPPMRRAR